VRTRFVWLAALNVGVAVAAVGSSPVAVAQASGPASWRISPTVKHYRLGDDLLSLAATGARDAWALGLPGLSVGGRPAPMWSTGTVVSGGASRCRVASASA